MDGFSIVGMASTLMGKAAQEIRRKDERLKNIRRKERQAATMAAAGVGTTLGTATAALTDVWFGEGGEPARVLGVPVNIAVGAITAVGGTVFAGRSYTASGIAGGGIGMFNAGLYRWIVDNVEFEEEEEAG